ncbi:MAG: hypothetical protein OIF32_03620 [Campylobacterales bacterium]|nr:hypothetical protein [Campylobacterales bacterium]
MTTDRDNQILELICTFGGKTYFEVLEQTFWNGKSNAMQQVRNRINTLVKKYKLLRLYNTSLATPRSAIVLTDAGKRYCENELGLSVPSFHFSATTVYHGIMEQLTYFHFRRLNRSVERVIVKGWSKNHKHTPDFYYTKSDETIYIEVERTKKTAERYRSIFTKIKQDRVKKVVYVCENIKKARQISSVMDVSSSLYFVALDDLVHAEKIPYIKQKDL